MTYNADGNLSTLTARNGYTGDQTTHYIYGTTLADSGIATSTLKRQEIYPDSVDEDDVILFGYNRQSQVVKITDQMGTVHEFEYDLLGRQTQDRVTTLGTGVDGAVLRIATVYEVRGMKSRLTSYDDATVGMGAILNDCQYVYNDFGQLIIEYQSHSGAVNTGTSPNVQYDYADGSDNTIRPLKLTYPNGRELHSDYGTTDGMDDVTSRVASLIDDDGTTHLVDYSYLGSGSFVETDYTEPETKYTLVGTAGGNDPDTGDIYRGLDRFGRIKDSYWYGYGASSETDRIKYGYDRVGNRTYRENTVATAAGKEFDEQYLYDQIHRLKTMDRGTLNGSHTGLTSTTFGQCWTLDETGNWRGFREAPTGGSWDLIQSRTANPVNEITDITESVGPSWFAPGYNRAGNMATMPQPLALTSSYSATYDAWNRLVKLAAGADTVSEYAYDGAKRRIVQKSYTAGVLSETRHYYLTSGWRTIEERTNSEVTAERQFIWGRRYIDDLILRDRAEERLYGLQDANWNVTGFIDTTGAAQERVVYTAYGVPQFLTSEFVSTSDGYNWDNLYCGYRYESATGLFHVRHRILHPVLGCWVQRDPTRYADGSNLYLYSQSSPCVFSDSTGRFVTPNTRKGHRPGCVPTSIASWQGEPRSHSVQGFQFQQEFLNGDDQCKQTVHVTIRARRFGPGAAASENPRCFYSCIYFYLSFSNRICTNCQGTYTLPDLPLGRPRRGEDGVVVPTAPVETSCCLGPPNDEYGPFVEGEISGVAGDFEPSQHDDPISAFCGAVRSRIGKVPGHTPEGGFDY